MSRFVTSRGKPPEEHSKCAPPEGVGGVVLVFGILVIGAYLEFGAFFVCCNLCFVIFIDGILRFAQNDKKGGSE